MGLFSSRRPERTTSQPSWVSETPAGPLRFDPAIRTAAELVGQPAGPDADVAAQTPAPATQHASAA